MTTPVYFLHFAIPVGMSLTLTMCSVIMTLLQTDSSVKSPTTNLISLSNMLSSYAMIVWCSWRIWLHLRRTMTHVVAKRTRELNRQMNVVLFAQAFTPFLFIFLPSVYSNTVGLLKLTAIVNPGMLILYGFNWMPVANAAFSLVIIQPYRKAIISALTCRKEGTTATTVTVLL